MVKKQSKDPLVLPLLDTPTATLILFAIRYAMGRKSVAPCCVAEWLIENWGRLDHTTQSQIQREVEGEIKRDDQYRENHPEETSQDYYPLGWNCDKQRWLNLRKLWRNNPNVIV